MADPPPVLTLLVQKGPCKGETRRGRAGGAAIRVGRVAKGNDLAVRDAGASQSHLSVEFLRPPAARWAVTDLGSSNGTLLNGAPLVPTVPAPLAHGDLIKIGESTVLAVSISADEDQAPAPAATRRSARNAAAPVAAAEEEQAPAVTRRAGRKKIAAAEAPEAEKEVKEEAAVPTRRGGRKKATEPPDAEKEAAARRGDAAGSGNDEVKVERTGRGRGRTTRASARKAKDAVPEEVEEEPVTRDRGRNPPRVTVAKGGEEEDIVETRDGTSNASEELTATGRGRAKRGRGGRGRGTRASTRKAEDDDEKEREERDIADRREQRGSPLRVMAANDGAEEDKVATRDDKLDGTSKASMEDEKMVDMEERAPLALEGQTVRAIEGRVNAQHATVNNGDMVEEEGKDSSRGGENEVDQELREIMAPEPKLDDVGEEEETGNREAICSSGEEGCVEEHPGRSSLENMKLGEWFDRIEKYLLAKNEEAAEKAIAEVREKHLCFCEHLKTLKKSSDPS